jgi:DnaJ-class molecular chaperone
MADYYGLLGIERDADDKAIKSAYRKLALRYHPDRNPGDDAAVERFKEINEAYAVLSDGEKRARYDRYGTADPAPTSAATSSTCSPRCSARAWGVGPPSAARRARTSRWSSRSPSSRRATAPPSRSTSTA